MFPTSNWVVFAACLNHRRLGFRQLERLVRWAQFAFLNEIPALRTTLVFPINSKLQIFARSGPTVTNEDFPLTAIRPTAPSGKRNKHPWLIVAKLLPL